MKRNTGLAVAVAAVAAAGLAGAAVLIGGGGKQPSTGTLVLVDKRFKCQDYKQPLNFDRVDVNLTAAFTENIKVPIWFGQGGDPCGGRIGDLVARTVWGDVVKVTSGAANLTIEHGTLTCLGKLSPGIHQDVIQAQQGLNVKFQNLTTVCPTSNHSAFFVNTADLDEADWPRDVVCEFCNLGTTGTTVHIGHSFNSGVRDSTIHKGKKFTFRTGKGAVAPVNERNTIVP